MVNIPLVMVPAKLEAVAKQAQGFVGGAVDWMIRREVRRAFHTVAWVPPAAFPTPAIFVPNHHGWHDGYLMYIALTRMGVPFLDWIAEFDAFPFFGRVGGMPFPPRDAGRRAATIRQSIRRMKSGERSLLIFAESELHRPPMLAPFGAAVELVARQGNPKAIVPVAIRYEMGMHQRPEAYLEFGEAVEPGDRLAKRTRLAVAGTLDRLIARIRYQPETLATLMRGTPDISERWDFSGVGRGRIRR